jgi:hypothetical protein
LLQWRSRRLKGLVEFNTARDARPVYNSYLQAEPRRGGHGKVVLVGLLTGICAGTLLVLDNPSAQIGSTLGSVQAVVAAEAKRADIKMVSFYLNCDQVRSAGAAPLRRDDPGYSDRLDPDGNGIACEPSRRSKQRRQRR